MRNALLKLIRCPACGFQLEVKSVAAENKGTIWQGILQCSQCQAEFPIVNGMPYLYVDDSSWDVMRQESEGWVQIHKDKGIYEQSLEGIDFMLPYVDEAHWGEISKGFDLALSRLGLRGDELVLDFGAGRGWAAKQFACKGCHAVALDIVPDMNVGLGRAYAMMEEAQVEFDLIIGDGNKLPLSSNQFDIVFCCGTLHHASDMGLFLKSIAEILKPGGVLCAISEPCIPIWQDETRRLRQTAAEELAYGINEHLPNLPDYANALRHAGFQIEQALPSNWWNGRDTNWTEQAHSLGAMWGGFDVLKNIPYFLGRRLVAAVNGAFSSPTYAHVKDDAALAQAQILTWCGGALFLLARKRY